MLAKALGVNQLVVVVNKLDVTDPPWSEERYEAVKAEVGPFLARTGFRPKKVHMYVGVWRATGWFDFLPWPCFWVVVCLRGQQTETPGLPGVCFWCLCSWDGSVQGSAVGVDTLVAVFSPIRPPHPSLAASAAAIQGSSGSALPPPHTHTPTDVRSSHEPPAALAPNLRT